jgi:hypothetical protein
MVHKGSVLKKADLAQKGTVLCAKGKKLTASLDNKATTQ